MKPSCKLYNSWRESPDVAEDWVPAKPPGAVEKVPVKNASVLRELRSLLPGVWYKVYHKGRDSREVHYFQHASGKVANVKMKYK